MSKNGEKQVKTSVSLPGENEHRCSQGHRHSFSCHSSQHTFVLQVVVMPTGRQLTLNIYLSVPDGCCPFPGSITKPGLCDVRVLISSEVCACNLVAKFIVSIGNINNLISRHRSLCTFGKAKGWHISGQEKKEIKANGSLKQAQCQQSDDDPADWYLFIPL